jgi:hypothetical protein
MHHDVGVGREDVRTIVRRQNATGREADQFASISAYLVVRVAI